MAVTFNFFLLHLNLSYTKRIVLLVPVENIKIRNITTLFLDWPNWIVINITVGRYRTFLTSVHVHSLDIPNRHQYHHLGWPIFQSLCNLSFRAQGAPLVRWGLNSHTSFSEKLALVKSCILGAKWFVVISFWPTKNWWTERRKDIKINIEIIAKAASHKLPGSSSLNVNFLCPVCPSLFVQHVTFYLSDMLIWYTTIDLIQGRNHFPFFIQLWKSLVL